MKEKYERELRGYFTEAEYQEIMDWLAAEKKFAKPSHFVRHAIYSAMKKNRPGAHHALTGRPVGRPRAEDRDPKKRRHEATGRPVGRPHAEIAGNQGADRRPDLGGGSEGSRGE